MEEYLIREISERRLIQNVFFQRIRGTPKGLKRMLLNNWIEGRLPNPTKTSILQFKWLAAKLTHY